MLLSAKTAIEKLLQDAFSPSKLEVQDDSAQHAGHAGANPAGNTHFSLIIVTEFFSQKSLLERHRMIYRLLRPLMDEVGIHALGIKALTEQEWKGL
ncbi:MAG: BolA family transcriptional regulator [Candidatus Omnitrophica bacterium]|nr:BolA family transcriptional regulator [Candidatus Omnitrophota bacterium]